MIEFVKKNKNVILSSSILIGISYLNTFGKCCKNKYGSGKGNKNITNNSNNDNKTPDPDKDPKKNPPIEDPNGDKPEEDPLKNKKDELINLLNSVNVNNNKLEGDDKFKIDITPDIINSKKEEKELNQIKIYLNNINKQIIQKISEKGQEIAKEILRNECNILFENCENLNKELDKKVDLGITKNQIENEQDIDNLNTYKNNLNDKKTEIEKIIDNLKENLVMECRDLNKKLKNNVIENFYENEVLKTEYDDEINKDKTLHELNNIKSQLDYILKENILITYGKYQIIYYDEIRKDLEGDNIYRIMNIFKLLITNYIEDKYNIVKNEEDMSDPFGAEKVITFPVVLQLIEYLLEKDKFFNDMFKSLVKKIDGNSFFSNFFKFYFFTNAKKKQYYDMEKFNKETVSIILDFRDTDENKVEKQTEKTKLLEKHKITLGDKLEDNELLPYRLTQLKELNEQVFEKAKQEYVKFFL